MMISVLICFYYQDRVALNSPKFTICQIGGLDKTVESHVLICMICLTCRSRTRWKLATRFTNAFKYSEVYHQAKRINSEYNFLLPFFPGDQIVHASCWWIYAQNKIANSTRVPFNGFYALDERHWLDLNFPSVKKEILLFFLWLIK